MKVIADHIRNIANTSICGKRPFKFNQRFLNTFAMFRFAIELTMACIPFAK